MRYTVYAPDKINTEINLPASKSISNRALVIHALAGQTILPQNLSDCDDTKVMVAALRDMPAAIDIGAAGTAMRFLTAYLAATPGPQHVITGSERMLLRPIGTLVDALRQLGANIEYLGEEGFPPLLIKGRQLYGGRIEMPGNVSSQFISALLMVGPTMKQGLELVLKDGIVSRPYIDLTLHVMHDYGCKVEWSDVSTISVPHQSYTAGEYTIENDWSAASYWYEMLALGNNRDWAARLQGLRDGSRQGDSVVRYLYSMLGVKTAFYNDANGQQGISISYHGRTLPRLDYDFINQPDLVQTVAVTCVALDIPFRFAGTDNLRIKETDRIQALENELRKLGAVVRDNGSNELSWSGERCEPQHKPVIETYNDHRMAMSFAPLAIRYGSIIIDHPEVVTKSYPDYWRDLKKAGFRIECKQ